MTDSMKKLAIVFLLTLPLGACGTITDAYKLLTGTTVTPQQALIAANAFDVVEGTATNYYKLPLCVGAALTLCRTQSAVNAIANPMYIGRKARTTLLGAVTAANGAPVDASLMTALEAQTSTLQTIFSTYGVK